MGLTSVLPFLAALQKQVIPPNVAGNPMVGGANATPLPNAGDALPPPDLSVGQTPPQPQPTPQPTDAVPDLAQSMTQGQQAPKFHETKGHALMRILQSGVQGGLNGMAANAQTYAATGRNAGFGGGFAGAEQMPFLQAQRSQALQQGQAQIDLLRQQAQNINVPGYGSMPAGLAKVLFPSLVRGQYGVQEAQTRGQYGLQGQQARANATVEAARMGLGPMADVPQDLQQQFGLPAQLPLKMLNTAESAANRPLTTVAGANDTYVVNKQTNQKTPLGVGSGRIAATLARPVQVADPNNPGNITYESAGQAMKNRDMAPSSAPSQTAKATARSMAPGGKVGEEVNAFNTAIQHADLLKTAVSALNNGDQQTINSLKNRLRNEFGIAGPVTSQAIADAYSREVTKMLSSGHMTDSEISTIGGTLNPQKQSPEQILGVIDAYKALAQSKMNVRQQGVQRGLQGQANFPTQNEPTATGPNGHKIVYRNGAWVDAASGNPIQ